MYHQDKATSLSVFKWLAWNMYLHVKLSLSVRPPEERAMFDMLVMVQTTEPDVMIRLIRLASIFFCFTL